MEDTDFERYLETRYYDQIDWYDRKSIQSQKYYRRMQWTLLILAAATPVLIQFQTVPAVLYAATATSVVVAILTGALKTFKYQENWLNYRTTCETLRKEKHFFDAGVGEYSNADTKRRVFVRRVENLISHENTIWFDENQNDKSGTNQPVAPAPQKKSEGHS